MMGIIDRLRGTAPGDGPRAPARAIVAAAMPMSGPAVKRVAAGRKASVTDVWQNQAWYYFDAIGEVRGPMVWIANALSQADPYATELDLETGKPTGPTDNATAVRAAAMALGGPAKRAGLLRIAGLCWQCVGEYWLVVRPGRGPDRPDEWLVLSGSKVKPRGETWTYTDPFTGATVELGANELLVRSWSPHPEDQSRPDSAMRPALVDCQEVEKATQNLAARLDSRIAMNGFGAIAEELDFPKGDFDTSAQSFADTLLQTAEMNLANPGHASSQVPLFFTAPGQLIADGGAFAHYDISTEASTQVLEIRQDALKRLAAALDMPRDVAEGTQGESNHWSAWQVEESTYKLFIEPLLKSIGDVLTENWFRPALVAMGMAPEEAERYELGWDTTAIVARPDDTENLRDLHDRMLISDDYMRSENGIPEDAMPDEEEYTRRFLERVVLGAPTLLADPAVSGALGLSIAPAPAAAGVDATVTPGGELEPPAPGPGPNALPATQGDQPQPDPVPEGLVAAAELIVYDALSRAGGRLLTNQNRGQFKSTPRHELHTMIPALDATEELLEGSFQFVDRVAEAFGRHAPSLEGVLRAYTRLLVRQQRPHSRESLKAYLR